jgi:hypothetical protein
MEQNASTNMKMLNEGCIFAEELNTVDDETYLIRERFGHVIVTTLCAYHMRGQRWNSRKHLDQY